MPILTDAQWSKFEAAIAAVKLRGARPRKEDRRTVEAIIRRLDNGAKNGARSQRNWGTGTMPTCVFAAGLWPGCGTGSWRI